MQFTKATKAQAKLRMSISGVAGSGKTYTALSIASQMGTRIALIDTEHGSASKYADKFNFDVLELDSFHPQKYIEAIRAAEQAGYEILIIDSLTHAWAGKDGALELVDRASKKSNSGNKFMAWGDVTPLQNQLVDTIIAAKLHVIATMRSKTEYALQDYTDAGGRTKQKPVKLGMAPIQRDGMEYEFDIVGEMDMQNTLTIVKSRASGLNQTEWEKPSKTFALAVTAWLNDATPQPAPSATPAPNGHAVPTVSQHGPEWTPELLDEHADALGVDKEDAPGNVFATKLAEPAKPAPVSNPLPPKVFIPSHETKHNRDAEAFQELENLVAKHALAVNRVASIPEAAIARYRQQAASNLGKTALGDDDELRHMFLKEIWGRGGLTECNVQELMAIRDWSIGIPAKAYIALWVAQHPAFDAVMEKATA